MDFTHSQPKRIVIALGGNALQPKGGGGPSAQQKAAVETARQLAKLVQEGHELVITHGNGPQVGDILLREESAGAGAAPLDTCGAMTQGQIGYWLQQALGNELRKHGTKRPVATIVTQTIVDSGDPGFQDPSKPIGPFYPNEKVARAAAEARHFVVKEDAGRGWRRVVASPRPIGFAETEFITQAVASGMIVIAAGGGGVPVIKKRDELVGIEAVVDKDFAAATLAGLLEADVLLILTTVNAVTINYRTPQEQPLHFVSSKQMKDYINGNQFAPGSMLPKVEAALQFCASQPGRKTIITSPSQSVSSLRGLSGTHISQ